MTQGARPARMPNEAPDFKLSVLSPGGRDPDQYFDAAPDVDSPGHPPVNFHAFAACTGGSFHRDTKTALADGHPILLLLRGNFKATQRALWKCREQKRAVVVSLKETGLHQVAAQLADSGRLGRFREIVANAAGCIGATPEVAEIFRTMRPDFAASTVAFIPTPYPLEDERWNLSIPPDRQAGILVGTREWNVPSRNHAAALLFARVLAEKTGETVTVFNFDGRKGRKRLEQMEFPKGKLRVIEERMPYAGYVREVAKHKVVLQLDRSRVPGQVAGDALLARTICVGGDGTVERIAFANSCGQGRTFEQLEKIAIGLMTDTHKRATAIVESQWRAAERLSFSATAKQLQIFFNRVAGL